jgi:hypothetical protein
MVDVYLASDNVTVLGGPSTVSVDVDFGVRGDRGSNFFVGYGNPNLPTLNIGQTPQVLDMYINISAADEKYLHLYQYQNIDGSLTWVELLKLIPNTFSGNYISTFVDGEVTINVPVANIVPAQLVGSVGAASFNIQFNILNSSLLACSSTVSEVTLISDVLCLPITFKASELVDNAWTPLSGQKALHLFITVV